MPKGREESNASPQIQGWSEWYQNVVWFRSLQYYHQRNPKGDGTVISCRALHWLLVQVIYQTCVLSTLLYVSKDWALLRRHWEGTVYHITRDQLMLWQQVYVKIQAIKHFTLAMLQCCNVVTTCCQQTTTGNVTTAAPNGWATLCNVWELHLFLLLTTTNGRPKKRRRNKIRVDQLQTVVTQISNMSLTQFLSRVGVLSAMEQCQVYGRTFRRKEDKKWYPGITETCFMSSKGQCCAGPATDGREMCAP